MVQSVQASLSSGRTYPLGASVTPGGVNFCLYSKHSTSVELLLFDERDLSQPSRVIAFDPQINRTFHYWHIFVPQIGAGQIYAYRVYGPMAPERGLRFDGDKVLLDPYARAVVGDETYSRSAAASPGDNCDRALKGVVVDSSTYDWEGDTFPRIPYASTVIYELHVGGFTRNPNSGIAPHKRGTYAGLIEKIPYLQELGVTTVELLPVHQFDEQDAPLGRKNYWGYSTIAFFAPHRQYSSNKDPLGPVNEFRDMVKAFHRAGIEVILDVVYNHTAEGNDRGPTLSLRGQANDDYYILEQSDPSTYSDYSGCGNSLKANSPVCGRVILESLRYWVTEMHVDGFRFDLASVLARKVSGQPPEEMPILLWAIESDEMLAGTKLIVEAWDAAGMYSVGQFVRYSDWYAEWNGPFRDDVRRFVKGDRGAVSLLASRLSGSSDIYTNLEREPNRSINFITCHDGFTLNDLVSYDRKHNEGNGEDNRDGANDNFSWNCGIEGPTDDPEVEALRLRQMENLLTVLFISHGTPMMSMGDEVRRSQQGNNNVYCQDNSLSWFDWDAVERHADILRFTKLLISFTQSLQLFCQERIFSTNEFGKEPYLKWHGVQLNQPDWGEDSHVLAFELCHPQSGEHLYIAMNAYWEPLQLDLPQLDSGQCWHRLLDTSLPSPDDISPLGETSPVASAHSYAIASRSCAILVAQ